MLLAFLLLRMLLLPRTTKTTNARTPRVSRTNLRIVIRVLLVLAALLLPL